MNWHEWRMRWVMFWLFVLVLIIVVTGCSNKVDVLDPMPNDFGPHHQDVICEPHYVIGIVKAVESDYWEYHPGVDCRNLRLT